MGYLANQNGAVIGRPRPAICGQRLADQCEDIPVVCLWCGGDVQWDQR